MKNINLVFVGLFILILSGYAFSLQASYMYVSLSYGRGWWPYACVVEKGVKGFGSPVNYCGARSCPFGDGAMYGYPCLDFGSFPECANITDDIKYAECIQNASANLSISFPRMLYPPMWGVVAKITVPEDLKLVASDGYVINDEVCVGDKIKADKGVNKGEYWNDGGHEDSPPIQWVANVEKVFDKVLAFHEANPGKLEKIMSVDDDTIPGFVDDLPNLTMYWMPVHLYYCEGCDSNSSISGALACSLKKVSGKSEGEYQLYTQKGDVDYDERYSVECMYYYWGGRGGYVGWNGPWTYATVRVPTVLQAGPDATYEDWGTHNINFQSKEDFFKVGEMGIRRKLHVVDPARPSVVVEVPGVGGMDFSSENVLRMLVNNTGDVNVSIWHVGVNGASFKLVSCDKDVLAPGESGECLLSVTPTPGAAVALEFSYGYSSCGRSLVGLVTKTLADSEVVKPYAVEQVYGINIYGDCSNRYYECSPVSDKSSVGYLCSKGNGNFYAAMAGRLDLSFGLPMFKADFLSARLVLPVSDVNVPQSLSVYSLAGSVVPVSCVPGGDICTKPYCAECDSLFENASILDSSTRTIGAGKIYVDVSSAVREAYNAGRQNVSLQIRGKEDVWSEEKEGSCGVDSKIKKYDVGLGQGVYLEILHR